MGKHGTRVLLLCLAAAAAGIICLNHFGGAKTPQENHEIRLPDAATREAWLNLYGFAVTPISEESPRMPSNYQTDAGKHWLELQQMQGISPTAFAGRDAVRYVYHVDNVAADTCFAELYLCGDRLAGAVIFDASTQEMMRVK